MDFKTQILFLLSMLGGINGLLLSLYFAFFTKRKHASNYFLSALLLALSVRIIKSAFFYFNDDLSQLFIQVGLSACLLIGPFLYLYLRSVQQEKGFIDYHWLYHTVPFLTAISIAWFIIPYRENRHLWSPYLVLAIYMQWLIYLIFSAKLLKDTFIEFISKDKTLNDFQIFQLSIYIGTTIIWFAYVTSRYTSYIVGALSFSFVFYLILLLWFFKRNKNSVFFEKEIKYANKKISTKEVTSLRANLERLMTEKQLYKNPSLKLSDVAKELDILPHYLSQFLNDNLGKSFSLFLNEHRITAVEHMLVTKQHLTLEAIGNECGFNSNSTFYAAFKKIKGMTPAKFKSAYGS